MAFLHPDVRTNSDQAVRAAFAPLKRVAEELGCTILLVRHLNKSLNTKALYRGGGSIGIIGLTRAAVFIGQHPEEGQWKLFAPIKNNLGRLRKPWAFSLAQDKKHDLLGVHWHGESAIPVSRVLDERREPTPVELCAKWLASFLAAGGRPAKAILTAAQAAGFSGRTVLRAKEKMEVVSDKIGAAWVWRLPDQPIDPVDAIRSSEAKNG